jgi:hypothetical protein
VFGVSLAADGEGGESFPKHIAISTRLEGAEDLINNLGGQRGQVFGEDWDQRVNGAFLNIAAKNGVVLSLGRLGKDLVDFGKVVIISSSGHLVHVGSKVFSIVVDEGLLGLVSFKLKALLGILVEDSLMVLHSSVEGCVGELGSPDSHTCKNLVNDAGGASIESLAGGR